MTWVVYNNNHLCVRYCTKPTLSPYTHSSVRAFSEAARACTQYLLDIVPSPPSPLHSQLGAFSEAARACTQYLYYNPHNDGTKNKFHMYKRLRKVTKDDLKPAHTVKYVSQSSPIKNNNDVENV